MKLLSVLVVLLLSFGQLRAAETAGVILENRVLRMEIARAPAPYIRQLVHRATGTAVVAGPERKNLFAIVLEKPDGATETVESSRAGKSEATLEKAGQRAKAVLKYSAFSTADLSVEVTAESADQEPLVQWSMRVTNRSGRQIKSVRFPMVEAAPQIGHADDDVLVLPALPGALIENPAKNWGVNQSVTLAFPGNLSAQFVAYQDRTAGLFMQAMDAGSYPMSLSIAKRPGTLAVQHEFAMVEQQGEEWKSPYAVALGVTQGAWHDTADLYKRWAVRQPWCAKTLAQREDIPAWWKAGPAVHVCEVRTYDAERNCNGSYYPALAEHLRVFREKIDGPVVPMFAGWENHRRWTAGDYFPVFDEKNAKPVIQQLRQSGFRPFFFLSGLFYTFANEGRDAGRIPAAEQFLRHFVVDKAGKTQVWSLDESSPTKTWKRQSYQFCVGDPATEKFFCDVLDRAHALGVDVVQMDQTVQGAGAPCYATGHAHPPGPGLYTTREFQRLLDRMRNHGKGLSPDFVLFHEEPHEQLIGVLDGFHVREYYEKRWYRGQPGAVGIPLFDYLYHEYAIGYGGDSAGLSRNKDPWLVRCHAMNLVTGRTPGAAVWSAQQNALEPHGDQLAMLRNHSRLLKTRAKEFLMLGRMLHPYELDVPRVRSSVFADGKKHEIQTPAVLTSSWQSPAGQVGHLFVNLSDTAQPLVVPLDTREVPSPGRSDVTIFRSTAGPDFRPLWQKTSLPREFRTELAPMEALFLTINAAE